MKTTHTSTNSKYSNLLAKTKKIAYLQGINSLLSWDQETMMPEGATAARAEQIAYLSGVIHSLEIDHELWELLEDCYNTESGLTQVELHKNSSELSDTQVILLRLKKDIEKARKLPQDFIEIFARTTSEAIYMWQKAKKENNWTLFEPYFQNVVDLVRQKAMYLRHNTTDDLYAALLDEYEPEANIEQVNEFFTALRHQLVPLSRDIISQQRRQSGEKPQEPAFSLDQQLKMAKDIISLIGYDWSKSRLDVSSHPFSNASHPTDSRITIRNETNEGIISQLMSALHEAGHSLYEMGLPIEYYGTPLCQAASLSIHESQSRLWETVIGRSRPFMKHICGVISSTSNYQLQEDALYRMINWVEPSCIRTEADEVTYPLHVMLRYEIEKELISGSLSCKDIPTRWNEMMYDLLGIIPSTNRLGCLQDIHWSMGAFGYFPTYTLGSWYSICLFKKMQSVNNQLFQLIEKGDFSFIHSWLKTNIWAYGRRHLSHNLIQQAIGRAPSASDYISYLQEKYLG